MRNKIKIAVGGFAVAALVAVSLGGSATAASQVTSADIKNQTIESWDIAAGGVASSEVRNQSLKSWDLARGSVAGSELRNGSVQPWDLNSDFRDFVESRGTGDGADGKDGVDGKDGEKGDRGDQGTPGADGADGMSGYEVIGRTDDAVTVAAGETESVTTKCLSDNQPEDTPTKVAVGGGAKTSGANVGDVVINTTAPGSLEMVGEKTEQDPAGVWASVSWDVTVTNIGEEGTATVQPFVICALAN